MNEQQGTFRIEFEFWCEFFLSRAVERTDILQLPVLVQKTGDPRPSHLIVHPITPGASACIELVDLFTGASRRYPMEFVRHIKFINQAHVSDPSVEGVGCICVKIVFSIS